MLHPLNSRNCKGSLLNNSEVAGWYERNNLMIARLQSQTKDVATPLFYSLRSGVSQRKCACGGTPGPTGECAECRRKRLASQHRGSETPPSTFAPFESAPFNVRKPRFAYNFSRIAVQEQSPKNRFSSGNPSKSSTAGAEGLDQEKPSPMQGSATIQCDGSGNYEIVYGTWAGATCGTKGCVTAHESSHIADWKSKWPTGCNGQPKGYLPKGDPPDKPLLTAAEYKTFLKESECKAHTVDLACAEALPKPAGCEKTVDDYIKLTRDQKANWCPSMSRGAKVGVGIAGGAVAGAGVGALVGGPVGAAIGAGIGAIAGGIAGLLV